MKTTTCKVNNNSIEVAHQGAHLCSWICRGQEQLYLSPSLIAGKAIRGGVPVIFPQFEEFGDGPRHGFARTANWKKVESKAQSLHFALDDSDESWPYSTSVSMDFFLAENSLSMNFSVRNNDTQAIQFTCALHTYFRVSDIRSVALHGLKDLEYWTNAEELCERRKEESELITFTEKVDRIYFASSNVLQLKDGNRNLTIESQGFEDIVVWNPWAEDASKMADMPDNDYQHMLCIEPARVNNPVVLQPGESWSGVNILKVI